MGNEKKQVEENLNGGIPLVAGPLWWGSSVAICVSKCFYDASPQRGPYALTVIK